MAENRLFQMLFILLENGRATAPELSERFEVSVRTIYRDIDILSAAGIPVYTIQGKGGGIFIQENYVLNKSLISEQEQNQILLALQGMGMINEETTNALLTKLGGIFQKQNINWLEVDFRNWHVKSKDLFAILRSAVFQSKIVNFTYYSSRGKSENRNAEPLKLVFRSREWYLYAYCHHCKSYRIFKLVRIKNLKLTEESFTRMDHPIPEKVFIDNMLTSSKEISLTLVFDKELAYRVYDHFDDITEMADGSSLVTVTLPDDESSYQFLLSFGDRVEVVEPPEVREIMITKIENMLNKYRT